jgi:hypothetical protein
MLGYSPMRDRSDGTGDAAATALDEWNSSGTNETGRWAHFSFY